MNANWIDYAARRLAGSRIEMREPAPAAEESAFTRATALRLTAAFGLASLVPTLRPAVALGSDPCQARCDAASANVTRAIMKGCLIGTAPIGGIVPSFVVAKTFYCAVASGLGAVVNAFACADESEARDSSGKCTYRDNPPRVPRQPVTYPPKKLDQPQRPKLPPGGCAESGCQPGHECHACPTVAGGSTCCARPMKNGRSPCCPVRATRRRP